MPRLRPDDDPPETWDDQDDDPTDDCPQCGRSIYDDSERCPYCGHYLTRETHRAAKPWYVILGVVLCLVVVAWWLIG